MGNRVLLGFAGLLVLVLALSGLGAFVALNWDRTGIDTSKAAAGSLGRELEEEFGGQADVVFECIYPVVGVGPCLLDTENDSREVRLTFTDHQVPDGVTVDDEALRIALRAIRASEFAAAADRIAVVFESSGGGAVSIYSFTAQQLADTLGEGS